VTAEYDEEPGAMLVAITGDGGQLSTDPERNTACIAANAALHMMGVSTGARLWLDKGLPLASGLGSSAASAVAAAVAVNELYDTPLSRGELLPACIEAEAAVSGRHADNVAPALLGGILLVTGLDASTIHRLPVPDSIYVALVTPEIAVPTATARAVLPPTVSLRAMVTQTGLVATLIHALYTGDLALLGSVIQQDSIVTPARAGLIPGLAQAQAAAHEAGALASMISGAGPTICALCETGDGAQAVTKAFNQVYKSIHLPCTTRIARPSLTGAVLL
jgi:homoserine kinase